VGAGIGGISATYQMDLVNRLSKQLPDSPWANHRPFNLSRVLIIEKDSSIGGDADYQVVPRKYTDPNLYKQTQQLYNWTGPIVVPTGPQRVPLLTLRLMRGLAVDSKTLLEYAPYLSIEDTRGRIEDCPYPDFSNYSPSNPYGMPSACTGVPKFVGDTSIPWSYDNTGGIGPAFNLTSVQPWAYVDSGDGGLFAASLYLIYGEPNPVKCATPALGCEACGGCFTGPNGRCREYLNLKAALIGELGHELYEAFAQDYGGFYGDFEEGLHSPCNWAAENSWWFREFDTNTLNGYPVGSFIKYIDNMAEPIKRHNNILLETEIVSIDTAGGKSSIIVTDKRGKRYNADFMIFAAPPTEILTGKIRGDVSEALLKKPEFHSVYAVSVTTVTVSIPHRFWNSKLPPNLAGATSEWVVLRSFGNEGCVPRLEIQNTIYGGSALVFRASYSDYLCKNVFQDIQSDLALFETKLWTQLRNDIAYIFQIPLESIDTEVDVEVDNFPNGWFLMYSNATVTALELEKWAAKPLGDIPVCLIQEAWNYKYYGWAESSMRLAQGCLDRIVPGSSDLIEKYLYALFPECSLEQDCYSNPGAGILGTETIVPSRFCNERFWISNFTETPNCIDNVHL
jgi:hypothetical protein